MLLAFCAAQVLAQIPLTPGGLGFVEAGLSATLTLAGVGAGTAVVATFAYRLFAYWLQLPLGLVGLALQRRPAAAARAGKSPPRGDDMRAGEPDDRATAIERSTMSHLVAIAYDDLDTAQQVVANIGQAHKAATRSSSRTS